MPGECRNVGEGWSWGEPAKEGDLREVFSWGEGPQLLSLFQFSFVNILFLVPGDISHMCCFLKKPAILLDSFSLFLKTTFHLTSDHDAKQKSGQRFSLLPFQVPFRSTTILCKCVYVLGTKNSSYRKLDREECLSHPHPPYPPSPGAIPVSTVSGCLPEWEDPLHTAVH